MLEQWANRWALITGASSGIGAEFARQLAARGMHLVLTARRIPELQALAAELHDKHATRCEIIPADLVQTADLQLLLERVAQLGHPIELLVNNAGFGMVGEVDDADVQRIIDMIQLNVSASTQLLYRLLPGMLARGSGAVINVSSLSGFQPVAYMGVYAATKAYLLHLSESLAVEVRRRGVTVLAVCPGVTQTSFFDVAGAPGWLQKHSSQTAEEVVSTALSALERRKFVVVPGWRNYFLTLLVRIASRHRVVQESTRYFRPKRKQPPT